MSPTPIQRIRRFNRAVTVEVGALDASYLGRGRPLGVARVLCAVTRDGIEVTAIRDLLQLDKGLLSRVLKGLEEEGLVTLAPDPEDGRRRIARLTPQGEAEVARYDALSDGRAERLLKAHPRSDALLAAMDLVASALGQHRIEVIPADPRSEDAIYCLGEYYAELGRRFAQGFDVNLSRDPDAADMVPPRGGFFIAMSDGLPIGCVALKGWGEDVAEIKRLWIAPSARGLKLSHRLMAAAEDAARDLGIRILRLDTNSALPEAIALYRRTGWTEIPRYNDDPYPDVFFEKTVAAS